MADDPHLGALGPADRHRVVARRFGEVIDATNDLQAPTPVAGWVAGDVVGHLMEWLPGFLDSGGVELPAVSVTDGDLAAAWRSRSLDVQALLDDPERAGSPFVHPHVGAHALADAIDRFYVTDVFMHTWDLARAAGVEPRLDPTYCAMLLDGMEPIDELLRSSGQYGPRFPVADAEGAVSRLIAFIGRDPHWRAVD